MVILAHKDGLREQTLVEHSENTAILCSGGLMNIDKKITYATGLLHDLGKYQQDFQDKLNGKIINVDHSTVGAKYILTNSRHNPLIR